MWVDYLLAFSVQFFPRTQIQSARPAIPTNTASIRAGAQPPTAAVYPTNQPIMMTMAPMPFPSPQPAQYYIPQVTHTETHIPLALTKIEQGSPDWFSTGFGLGGLTLKLCCNISLFPLAVSPRYTLRGTSSAVFCTASRVWHLLPWSRARGVCSSIS